MPIGTDIKSVTTTIATVLTIAGIMDTFSLLYSHAKSFEFKFGIPFTKIYITIVRITASVISAPPLTKNLGKNPGLNIFLTTDVFFNLNSSSKQARMSG